MAIHLNAEVREKKKQNSFLESQLRVLFIALYAPWKKPLLGLLSFSILSLLLILLSLSRVSEKNLPLIPEEILHNQKIVLFLRIQTTPHQAQVLTENLMRRPEIRKARFISPEEGLKRLTHYLPTENWVAQLAHNPLPYVIELSPNIKNLSYIQIFNLYTELKAFPQIEKAQYDLARVKATYSQYDFFEKLFDYGVLLIIFITIAWMTKSLLFVYTGNSLSLFYCAILYGVICSAIAWFVIKIFSPLFLLKIWSVFGKNLIVFSPETYQNLCLLSIEIGLISALLAISLKYLQGIGTTR